MHLTIFIMLGESLFKLGDSMRKYIALDIPINNVKKVMIVQFRDEVTMFLYDTLDDKPSIGDYSFKTLQEAEDFFIRTFLKETNNEVSWVYVSNPMKNCQEDLIEPVRVKGIDTSSPQWGTYEKVVAGQWIDIKF